MSPRTFCLGCILPELFIVHTHKTCLDNQKRDAISSSYSDAKPGGLSCSWRLLGTHLEPLLYILDLTHQSSFSISAYVLETWSKLSSLHTLHTILWQLAYCYTFIIHRANIQVTWQGPVGGVRVPATECIHLAAGSPVWG